MTATGGAITTSGGNTIHTFYGDDTFTVQSIATSGQYFVSYKDDDNKVKLSAIYDPYGLYPIVHGTTGTATFSTLATTSSAISKATEKYNTDDGTQYRYYILDDEGYVWVFDTQVYDTTVAANGIGEAWMLPDPTDYGAEDFNSIAILNGWLVVLNNSELQGKPTVDLGRAFVALEDNGDEMQLINPFPTHTNPTLVGHQGKMYYGDGNFVGMLFPTTSLTTSLSNTQSYARFTGSGTTCTLSEVISGSAPFLKDNGTMTAVPVVVFASETGTLPAGYTEGLVVYAKLSSSNPRQFTLYLESEATTAIPTNTVGTETFINTFYPVGEQKDAADIDVELFEFQPQRLNLPTFEQVQCMVEVGNVVLIGGITNTLYPWNQVTALPSDLIALPEANVKTLLNVNNMAMIFAGNKGNIYISNNSSANLLLKVPDYCAGVPGTPQSYTEPVFTWGDAVYQRGRVYFSILDQSATKDGNCGGVWSFYPTQNFFYGQDTGLSLRLENQNSYGTYNGYATILISAENQLTLAAVDQDALAPQYWAAWQDDYSVAQSGFGIDFTNTIPVTNFAVETDLVSTGTFLDRKTFGQVEYKVTSPLAVGESVQLYYRTNSTAAWVSVGTVIEESTDRLSGYFKVNFQKTQWLQLRAVATTTGDEDTSSFVRLSELRIR